MASSRKIVHVVWGDRTTHARILGQQNIYPASTRTLHGLLDGLILLGMPARDTTLIFHQQECLIWALLFRLTRWWTRGAVVVYDMHDLADFSKAESIRRRVKHAVLGGFEWLAPRLGIPVICATKGLSRIFYRRYGRSCRVVYSMSYDGHVQSEPQSSVSEDAITRGRNGHEIAYLGQIYAARVPLDEVDRLHSAGYRLHLHGYFPKSCNNGYKTALLDHPGVVFHGRFDPLVLDFVRNYDATLVRITPETANLRFCMPNKVFQSLENRCPCLVNPELAEIRITFRNSGIAYDAQSVGDARESMNDCFRKLAAMQTLSVRHFRAACALPF